MQNFFLKIQYDSLRAKGDLVVPVAEKDETSLLAKVTESDLVYV